MHPIALASARHTRTIGFVRGIALLAAGLALFAPRSLEAQDPPTLTSVTPARGATGVALSTPIEFVFDQPMMVEVPILPSMPGVFVGNLELSPASVSWVDGSWSDDGRSLICTPSEDWPPNTTITWKLNPSGTFMPITSDSGVALATASGSFTTGAGGGGGEDAPELVSSDPNDGAMDVPVTTVIRFVFDIPMKTTTALADAVRWQGTDVDPAKFVYSWSPDALTLTCDYTGDLPADTLVIWYLNPEDATVRLESQAGEPLPSDTYAGGFMTASSGGGDCTPDGIPDDWGSYSVSKLVSHQQTADADPVPVAESPFRFWAFLSGPDGGPAVASGSITLPNGTRHNLEASPWGNFFTFLDEPASETALNTAYPAGAYTLRFTRAGETERSIAMTMTAAWPPVPKIADFVAAQAVNHAQDFTLRWNAFTGAGTADHITLSITDMIGGRTVFQAPDLCVPRELPVTATSIVLPANTLENNKTYSASLTFGRMFYLSTNAVPRMAGVGMVSRDTQFTIKTGTGGVGTAARFTACRLLPNGNPEMTLIGTPLATYAIQRTGFIGASAAWTSVGSVTMTGGGIAVFEDTAPNKTFPVFYRAVAN